MAYDPTKPANGSPIVAAELRSQFAGLKQLIDDLPNSSPIADAIRAQAAGNCDGVQDMVLSISNPPTQAQVQTIANKLDELIYALRRV